MVFWTNTVKPLHMHSRHLQVACSISFSAQGAKELNVYQYKYPNMYQGFSQDGKTASPNIFGRHQNNALDKFQSSKKKCGM